MTIRSPRSRSGFALIITIVLVAFLVLILVGLATFTRVETQVADNTAEIAKARQNAMKGLNIALGQLQRHAGRDKAVTARGDLFGHNDKRKNLVSIWNDDSGWGERAWLVGGSEPSSSLAATLAQVDDPTGAEDGTNVFLVGDNSVEDDADRILVKKQVLQTEAANISGLTGNALTTIGHYAYWVGDEGAKASLNVIDPTQATTVAPNYNGGTLSDWANPVTRLRLNQQMLPQPQVANIRTELSPIDITAAATADQLEKVESLHSLSFVPGFPIATSSLRIRELFHDVTPRSEAVLANLNDGGDGRLKTDLSADAVRTADIRAYITTPLAPAGITDYASIHDVSSKAFPVLTEGSIRLSFYRDAANTQLKIAYQIDVELWNPYASTLRYRENGDGAKNGNETDVITIEVAGLPMVTLTTNGTPGTNVAPANLDLDATLDGGTLTDANVDSVGADLSWGPGEFKVLSSNGGDLLIETATPSPRVSSWSYPITDTTTTNQITVAYGLLMNTIEFRLKVGSTLVGTYKPTQTFNAGSTPTGAASPTTFALGYGVQFENLVETFARDEDPRQSDPPATCFEQTTWQANPALNATTSFDGTDIFRYDTPQVPIVLFDLPRQEVVSVGQLRHMIGNGPPYRAADGLYDSRFFSTTPTLSSLPGWTLADISTQPLPNRYLRVVNPLQITATSPAATETFLRDGAISARYLMQTAAFNINSTSVAAWRAMLGAKINTWRYGPTGASNRNLNHAFFRLGHGAQTLTNAPLLQADISDAVDIVYSGGRDLTTVAVSRLAEQIVIRSRARVAVTNHPYYSLQEFIAGDVIEDAIQDVTDDTILANADRINQGLAADYEGTPGELTQEDVIAAIAPMITARSDTFKIRSYGDVYNSITGEVTGRAWCEAVVQRVPDIAENLALATGGAGNTVTNPDVGTHPFGRKFIVVSFRWLTSNDI